MSKLLYSWLFNGPSETSSYNTDIKVIKKMEPPQCLNNVFNVRQNKKKFLIGATEWLDFMKKIYEYEKERKNCCINALLQTETQKIMIYRVKLQSWSSHYTFSYICSFCDFSHSVSMNSSYISYWKWKQNSPVSPLKDISDGPGQYLHVYNVF